VQDVAGHEVAGHEAAGHEAAEPGPGPGGRGLLLDIGGVVVETGIRLVARLAEREPAIRPLLDRIGGLGSERDELWQRMLRREVTDRAYWAQWAAEVGAALGETWDTRAGPAVDAARDLLGLPPRASCATRSCR